MKKGGCGNTEVAFDWASIEKHCTKKLSKQLTKACVRLGNSFGPTHFPQDDGTFKHFNKERTAAWRVKCMQDIRCAHDRLYAVVDLTTKRVLKHVVMTLPAAKKKAHELYPYGLGLAACPSIG